MLFNIGAYTKEATERMAVKLIENLITMLEIK